MENMQTDLKKEIIFWSKRLYDKDLSPATSGNISVRCGNNILISASGVCLGDISENDISQVDFDGNVLNNVKPSSEKYLHILTYIEREDVNAIIHSHAPYISAFAAANKKITAPILPDLPFYFGEVPIAPYFLTGSMELAACVSKILKKCNCTLLKNHGVVIVGENLKECFYNLESLNAYVQTFFAAEILGGAKNISKKGVEEIRKLKK